MFACHDGWHVVAHEGAPTFVRVAIRLRDDHGTYVYQVGSAPDAAECRTVWCHGGNGVPWICTACGEPISARVYDPYRPLPHHSFKKALVDPFVYFVDPQNCLPKSIRGTHATLAMRAYYARLEQSSVTDREGG
jgi:hypothetical protein